MARLWAKLKGFFAHFIVVSSRFIVNFTYFIAVVSRIFVAFSHLFAIAFRFIIVLTHLFTHKRHFLGHCAFLKFLNALFLGFCVLFCHFEPLQKGKKSTQIKRKLAIFGYFADAQYDKFGLLSKNDRQRKCTLLFHNESGFCHFERSDPTGCKAQSHKSALNSLLKLNFRLR